MTLDTMSSEKPNTREKILDASSQLLAEHQGKGVRMSDIAKATGISRQALYLHFPSRTELLVATTRHIDERLDVDRRLAPSRAAKTGRERLVLFVDAWGNYIPEIYGVARVLIAAQDTDDAAATAWQDRMLAMKDGCRAAIEALQRDGDLAKQWDTQAAIDMLWTLLSVQNWENLTRACGLSNAEYVARITQVANGAFVRS